MEAKPRVERGKDQPISHFAILAKIFTAVTSTTDIHFLHEIFMTANNDSWFLSHYGPVQNVSILDEIIRGHV